MQMLNIFTGQADAKKIETHEFASLFFVCNKLIAYFITFTALLVPSV